MSKSGNANTELDDAYRLLSVIADAQGQFITETDRRRAFDKLLNDVLKLTLSEYGFIGEVLHDNKGAPYLKTYAITNIAWNADTNAFYKANAPKGLEFYNLKTLFGAALTTGEVVIANTPYSDPRRGGLPDGHPALNAFLGLPIHHGDKLVAMLGLANRPNGYDHALVDFLEPLLVTIGQLVTAAQLQVRYKENAQQLLRLSKVASQTTNGVIITDKNGLIEWINEGCTRITGYTLAELVGKKPGDVLQGPDTSADTVAKMREALAQNRAFDVEIINYTKSKTPYWIRIQCNPLFDEDGLVQGFMAIEADITEAKKSADALKANEARLRALFELSPIGIALNDYETGAFLDVNDALLKPSGYRREEFLKLSFWQLTPKDYEKQEQDKLQSLAINGRYGPYEKEYIRKDGSRYPVNLNGVLVFDHNGRKLIWSIVEDISERKRIEKLQNEFISTVSHELRTPLTAISGALGLLEGLASQSLPESLQNMLRIAHSNSQRLSFLVNDLLDIEKLLAGKMHFNLQELDLVKVTMDAISANQSYAAQFDVNLAMSSQLDEPVRVVADEWRLQQVLANLLSNAAKFSPKGGRVEVSISLSNQTAKVMVKDFGVGIPDDFKTHIFQKFSQADASDTRQKGGTGLGLAISKELIERMGGHIGFDSESGAGSTFYFELPIIED